MTRRRGESRQMSLLLVTVHTAPERNLAVSASEHPKHRRPWLRPPRLAQRERVHQLSRPPLCAIPRDVVFPNIVVFAKVLRRPRAGWHVTCEFEFPLIPAKKVRPSHSGEHRRPAITDGADVYYGPCGRSQLPAVQCAASVGASPGV